MMGKIIEEFKKELILMLEENEDVLITGKNPVSMEINKQNNNEARHVNVGARAYMNRVEMEKHLKEEKLERALAESILNGFELKPKSPISRGIYKSKEPPYIFGNIRKKETSYIVRRHGSYRPDDFSSFSTNNLETKMSVNGEFYPGENSEKTKVLDECKKSPLYSLALASALGSMHSRTIDLEEAYQREELRKKEELANKERGEIIFSLGKVSEINKTKKKRI